jgi:hypothetical protein
MILGILLASWCAAAGLSSCCAGSCPSDLLLRGGTPTSVSGNGADSTTVQAGLATLMTQRVYDPGTYINWCCSPHDASKLTNGAVATYLQGSPASSVIGTAARGNYRYMLTFNLPEGVLTVDSDFNSTQRIIYDVKGRQAESPSTRTVVAECTFVGQLAGQPVELSFQHELHAFKDQGLGGMY